MRNTIVGILAAVLGLVVSGPAVALEPEASMDAASCQSSDVRWTFDPPVNQALGKGTFQAEGMWTCAGAAGQFVPGLSASGGIGDPAPATLDGEYIGGCDVAILIFRDAQGVQEGEGRLTGASFVAAKVTRGDEHEVTAQILVNDQTELCRLASGRGPATSSREAHQPNPAP